MYATDKEMMELWQKKVQRTCTEPDNLKHLGSRLLKKKNQETLIFVTSVECVCVCVTAPLSRMSSVEWSGMISQVSISQ